MSLKGNKIFYQVAEYASKTMGRVLHPAHVLFRNASHGGIYFCGSIAGDAVAEDLIVAHGVVPLPASVPADRGMVLLSSTAPHLAGP